MRYLSHRSVRRGRAHLKSRLVRVWFRALGFVVAPLDRHGPPISFTMMLKRLYPASTTECVVLGDHFASLIPFKPKSRSQTVGHGWLP